MYLYICLLFTICIMYSKGRISAVSLANIGYTCLSSIILIFVSVVWLIIVITSIIMSVLIFSLKYMLQVAGQATFLLSGSTLFPAEPGRPTFILLLW